MLGRNQSLLMGQMFRHLGMTEKYEVLDEVIHCSVLLLSDVARNWGRTDGTYEGGQLLMKN